MKILHIWDIGGDSYLLAKYQNKLGHKSEVIKRAGYNPYGIVEFYNGIEQKTILSSGEFYLNALWKSRNFDILHVHCIYKLVPILRRFYPKKKIVLHYHGSDCRMTSPKKRLKAEQMSDCVLLSTPDLKKYVPEGQYVPNPIDTEHFKHATPKSTKAFTILVRKNKLENIKNFLSDKEYDIEFDVINSGESPIPYSKIPNLFSKYGIYMDLKFSYDGKIIPSMSNTGRQALAQGLKVLNYELKIIDEFPKQFEPENVVSVIEKIYAEL
jgi:hypothetical protein